MQLIKGVCGKARLMQRLCKGTNGILLIYGDWNFPMQEGIPCYKLPRKKEIALKEDLKQTITEVLKWNCFKHATVYIYGNFEECEIPALIELNDELDGKCNLIATVQTHDRSKLNQIIIDET